MSDLSYEEQALRIQPLRDTLDTLSSEYWIMHRKLGGEYKSQVQQGWDMEKNARQADAIKALKSAISALDKAL